MSFNCLIIEQREREAERQRGREPESQKARERESKRERTFSNNTNDENEIIF